MKNTLDIFLDPVDLFKRLDLRPTWLGPFIIVASLGILGAFWMSPVMERLMIAQAPEGLSAEMHEQMMSSIKLSKYYGVVTTPIVVLLQWSVSAFLLFGVAILFGADTSYRKTLSVLGHASIITASYGAVNVAVIYLRGVETVQSPGAIRATVISPAYLLSASAHPALHVLLENLNPFSLWYFALLGIGLYLTARLSKRQSAFVVGILWILQTGFLAGLALIVSRFSVASM